MKYGGVEGCLIPHCPERKLKHFSPSASVAAVRRLMNLISGSCEVGVGEELGVGMRHKGEE